MLGVIDSYGTRLGASIRQLPNRTLPSRSHRDTESHTITIKMDYEGRKRCRNNTKIEKGEKVYASHACQTHDDQQGFTEHVIARQRLLISRDYRIVDLLSTIQRGIVNVSPSRRRRVVKKGKIIERACSEIVLD